MRATVPIVVAALFAAPAAAAASTGGSLTSVADGRLTKLHLHVDGIGCDTCSKRLREALKKLDGVVAVDVDRARAALAVDFDRSRTSEQAIRAELTRHGFTTK